VLQLVVMQNLSYLFRLKRKLADKVAATGYYVVVPDFLHGDPFTPENANRPLPIWLKDHQPVSSSTSRIICTNCELIICVFVGNLNTIFEHL
jgi:dienelactone hydrolase